MARGFTEEEKARIRERLLEYGRQLFTQYGLEKTTVEELARGAGIAKGTFYLFYPAKEALYVEVLLRAIPKMLTELVGRSFGSSEDVREALVLYMKELVRLLETDELVRAAMVDGQVQMRLVESLGVREIQQQGGTFLAPLVEAIADAQHRGELVQGDPMEIVQVLGTIKILPLYRSQVPQEQYGRLVDRLAQVIADGLTCPARAWADR